MQALVLTIDVIFKNHKERFERSLQILTIGNFLFQNLYDIAMKSPLVIVRVIKHVSKGFRAQHRIATIHAFWRNNWKTFSRMWVSILYVHAECLENVSHSTINDKVSN